jgi:mRNA interferase RelE/StbE
VTHYRLLFTRRARQEFSRLPVNQRRLIGAWIDHNLAQCSNPRAIVGGKKLQGVEDGWRWRVGSYRILAILQDDVLLVEAFRIGHRREVYRIL